MKQVMAFLLGLFAALANPAAAEIDVREVTSPSGLTAWLVEDHSIPFSALKLLFRGGTSLDPQDKRGAIYLMTGLLEEGSGDLDARSYARTLEGLAATFSYDADQDSVSIAARFLTENRDAVADLLRQTIYQPRFDTDAVERVRGQVISGLMSDAKDPNDIVGETFSRLAYGDHPYGSSGKGTIESVSALTRDDMIAAHRSVFARDRVVIAAVGDITEEELGALLDDLLADLPENGPVPVGPANLELSGGITVVDFDTPQSVAMFGQPGIPREDEDFFAAYVVNHILGGGSFESRLMHEVREKRGLTYGVYSYLASYDHASVYLGSVSSGNDRIAEAIDVIRDQWEIMARDGVTAEELDAAKTYLTGAYPLRFDGNGRIANILANMQANDLPMDYITTRNSKVEAVTLEDANRVAAELLDPDALRFVVVGKPQELSAD